MQSPQHTVGGQFLPFHFLRLGWFWWKVALDGLVCFLLVLEQLLGAEGKHRGTTPLPGHWPLFLLPSSSIARDCSTFLSFDIT